MKTRLHRTGIVVGCLLQLLMGGSEVVEAGQRPYRIDDKFDVEEIDLGSLSFSTDGGVIAFTKRRAVRTLPKHAQSAFTIDSLGDDVWLHNIGQAGPARNLTNGVADGSGSWAPQWSPDGKRLAFLSTRGGKVALWVWERASDRTYQLAAQNVDHQEPFRWVDTRRLLCVGPHDGDLLLPLTSAGQTVGRASEAWARARRGELTASVVNSLEFKDPERRLLLVDVVSAKADAIGTTIVDRVRSTRWWLSPATDIVAFVRPVAAHYGLPSLVKLGLPRSVELRHLNGNLVRLDRPLPNNIITETVSWSPDGKELGFFAYGDVPINPFVLFGPASAEVMPDRVDSLSNPARLWRVNVGLGRVEQIDTGEVDLGYLGAPRFLWTASGEMVFHAAHRMNGLATLNNIPRAWDPRETRAYLGPKPTLAWWLLARDGKSRALYQNAPVPDSLQPINGGTQFIGVAQGDVWLIDPVRTTATNMTASFAPTVTYISAIDRVSNVRHVALAVAEQQSDRDRALVNIGSYSQVSSDGYYVLSLESMEVTRLNVPVLNAALVAFAPEAKRAVYYANDKTGARLWCGTAGSEFIEMLVETNTFVRAIASSKKELIPFTSHNSGTLTAVLSFPAGYKPGFKYPLVVEVYSGHKARMNPDAAPGGNADLFTSAGYAYLVPSIPSNLSGLDKEEGNALAMLSGAVLPAVDKAIQIGVADPERLFVMGWSRGGWSVAGLLAQTTRFKAAMAGAGHYNDGPLFGWSGASLPRDVHARYVDNPHNMAMPHASWKHIYPTDLPWWRDRERMQRNSPFNYVDRVQTPLLLIHGDMDASVSFDQSEDFFRALVAQRKRAQFVRYWGEGHNFRLPENVRDMWRRVFAWFDAFGDISRGDDGHMIFEGDRVRSRNGGQELSPQAFAAFEFCSTVGGATP